MSEAGQAVGLAGWWRRRRAARAEDEAGRATARALYGAAVARARRPALYARLGVPDTTDGRFEMVAIFTALVARRLRAAGEPGRHLARLLSEALVADLDASVRELGVGDLSVPKYVKTMAGHFLARLKTLEAALPAGDRAGLVAMLERNLYPAPATVPPGLDTAGLVAEIEAFAAELASLPDALVLAGRTTHP
jgi:cytochrome b pre-mRNA-processing protein 3